MSYAQPPQRPSNIFAIWGLTLFLIVLAIVLTGCSVPRIDDPTQPTEGYTTQAVPRVDDTYLDEDEEFELRITAFMLTEKEIVVDEEFLEYAKDLADLSCEALAMDISPRKVMAAALKNVSPHNKRAVASIVTIGADVYCPNIYTGWSTPDE